MPIMAALERVGLLVVGEDEGEDSFWEAAGVEVGDEEVVGVLVAVGVEDVEDDDDDEVEVDEEDDDDAEEDDRGAL